jgi:rfaE bifunctional protein kinase chain/domain
MMNFPIIASKKSKILVIGDVMLDRYLFGKVTRISPEAPVPILHFKRKEDRLGGAANVANNLKALEAEPLLIGIVGNDEAGKSLKNLAKINKIAFYLIHDGTKPTIVKERIASEVSPQYLLRIDYENTTPISKEIEQKIIELIKKEIVNCKAVVISDYAKGTITKDIAGIICTLARKIRIPIIVDTKPSNISFYKNVTLITPNLKEAKEAIKLLTGKEIEDIREIAKKLVKILNSNIFITMGEEGIFVCEKNGKNYHVPGRKVNVFDVTGAGDVVVAISALGLVSKMKLKEIAELANLAGSIKVQKLGTSVVSLKEIEEALNITKINATRKIVEKKWGFEDWIINSENYNFCGKRLVLKKGYQCSIHYHKIKNEVFYINKGLVLMELNGKKILMKPEQSIFIQPGVKHRFIGLTDSEIIEFSTFHKEEDSYRETESGKVEDSTFSYYLKKYAKAIKKYEKEN